MEDILDILNQGHEVNWGYICLHNKIKDIIGFSFSKGKFPLLW